MIEELRSETIAYIIKERAIVFLEWVNDEGWSSYDGYDRWEHGRVVLSSKDLYELFLKSTQK